MVEERKRNVAYLDLEDHNNVPGSNLGHIGLWSKDVEGDTITSIL